MRVLRLGFLIAFCVTLHAQTVRFTVDSSGTEGDATVNSGGGADGVCRTFNGNCTLQAAMDEVNASSRVGGVYVIDFEPCFGAGGTTIVTRSFEVSPNVASLTILGHVADRIVLDGSNMGGAFFYVRSPNTSLTIHYLTLHGGGSWDGDAAIQSWGTLTLDSVIIRYHSGAWGGAVYIGSAATPGVAHIRNCSFYGNYAFNGGAGIYVTHNGGTVPAELDLANSTISGNVARGLGAIAINGHATIRNATIVNNDTQFGIAFWGFDAILDLGNSIVAGNGVRDLFDDNFYTTTFNDRGNNLIGEPSNEPSRAPITYAASDLLNVNPMLGALDENGGPTPTHALFGGSPAINAGNNALGTTSADQRNFQRVVGGTVDIGAYEFGASELPQPTDAPPPCHPPKSTPTLTVVGGTFTYDGQPHPAIATLTGANGVSLGSATITYNGSSTVPVNATTYDVLATFDGDANYDSATATATITIDKATPSVHITGGNFTYDGQPHAATGTVTGVLSESLGSPLMTYDGSTAAPVNAGMYNVLGSFAGTANYRAATGTAKITITAPRPTSIAYTGDTYLLAGGPARLSAVLTDAATSGAVANQSITLTLGTQSCVTTSDASGRATCTISSVNQPLGPGSVLASFAGTVSYLASTTSAATLVYAFPAGGVNFVIGDLSAKVGNNVTFWGAQWWKLNALSGGAAPAAFKGYVNRAGAAPSCGGAWSTDPGNSSKPPDIIPSYMAVIVSSSIAQSGSNISGNITHIAIIRTDAGYGANPGHDGTGTVVAVICR